MNARELVDLIGDPAVVQAIRLQLGLPSEPVAAELHALTEAHARLDDRMGRVEGALARLVEAPARTDNNVERLFDAQTRTDEKIERLVEAQTRTDEKIERLVEVQIRTDRELAEFRKGTEERLQRLEESGDRLERAMEELTRSQASLGAEMGAFSSTYGFTLEDVARTVLPNWLERHERIAVFTLEREFLRTARGEEEVDLFASGTSDDEEVVVIGEVKGRLADRDVERLRAKLERVRPALGEKRVVPLLFGFVVHPTARERGTALGIRVVASYDR